LSSLTVASPTFTADIEGEYVAQLTVNDGVVSSDTDSVSVSAIKPNTPPNADAGSDQNNVTGTIITLHGSGTDADGDSLAFLWSFSSRPSGSNAILNNPTTTSPTFTADIIGQYIAQLVVNDGFIDSSPKTVNINITAANVAPIALVEYPTTSAIGSVVNLDGTNSSDQNDDTLTYTWTLISSPEHSRANFSSLSGDNVSFKPDLAGDYIFELTVNDSELDSQPFSGAIEVTNLPPIALNLVGNLHRLHKDPTNKDIWLACTLPSFVGQTGTGIIRSKDNGKTWDLVAENECPNSMAFSKSNPDIILADDGWGKSSQGDYTYGVSTDNGVTWSFKKIELSATSYRRNVWTVEIDPSNSNEWWIISSTSTLITSKKNLSRTLDGGQTWQLVNVEYDGNELNPKKI